MGIVEEVGAEVTHIAPGDRVVIPFNISCGHCFMCDTGLQSQCETTQVREYGTGAALLGYTKLYGQVPGRAGRVPARPAGALRADQGARGPARRPLRATSPTCCRPRGRPSSTPTSPTAAPSLVLGLGPIGEMACRIAQHRGVEHVIGVDLVPERLERARAHGVERVDLDAVRRRPAPSVARAHRRARPGRGDRRGRHGGARRPVGKLAHTPAGAAARRVAADADGDTPASTASPRCTSAIDLVRRGGTISLSGVYGGDDRPDADDAAVRQADPAADGPGEREAAGSTTSCRSSPTTTIRSASRASRRTTCRSTRRRTPTRSSRRSRTARSRSCSSPERGCPRRSAARARAPVPPARGSSGGVSIARRRRACPRAAPRARRWRCAAASSRARVRARAVSMSGTASAMSSQPGGRRLQVRRQVRSASAQQRRRGGADHARAEKLASAWRVEHGLGGDVEGAAGVARRAARR